MGRPCPAGWTLRKFINCQIAMPRIRSASSVEAPNREAIRVRSRRTIARVLHGDAPWSKPRRAPAKALSAARPSTETSGIPSMFASHGDGDGLAARR